MPLHLFSLDFRHAPLALREQAAFPVASVPAALAALRSAGATEAAILSTCNRVTLIATARSPELLRAFLAEWHDLDAAILTAHGRALEGEAAGRYLMRVACGLESLVPGETQILGQVKEAATTARAAGMLGGELNPLFTAALRAGRRARQETGIARRPVSISHAAVRLVQAQWGDNLAGRCVLLVGAGKMAAVAARQLRKAGACHVLIANRTLEHACALARSLPGEPLDWAALPRALAEADAVISATAAPHWVLHAHDVAQAMAQRGGKPLLLVDLAVPRDIDPAAGTLPGVQLYDVDGLQETVEKNIALRNGAREQVEAIVAEELDRWLAEQATRTVASTIHSLRRSAESLRQAEVEKTLRQLEHLGEAERSLVEALSRSLVNKLLHEPTVCLRQKAISGEGERFQAAVEALFALEELS